MKMDQAKLDGTRALYVSLDKMSRSKRTITPTIPWFITAILTAVAVVAIICLAIKLIFKYMINKEKSPKRFTRSTQATPDVAQTDVALGEQGTTKKSSSRTRGSLGMSSKHRRAKPPPVSLYQIRQKQSPGSPSNTLKHISTLHAFSRLHQRSSGNDESRNQNNSDDNSNNSNNDQENSPVDVSQRSSDTEETSQMSRLEESQAGIGSNDVTEPMTENHDHQPVESPMHEQVEDAPTQAESDI